MDKVIFGNGEAQIDENGLSVNSMPAYHSEVEFKNTISFMPHLHWWERFWRSLQLIFKGECKC